MTAEVDLVVPFRAFPNHTLSKRQTRHSAKKAEKEYSRLIDTLTYSGLRAVGRRGESLGHILIFVSCPNTVLNTLRKREGLPSPLAPSDRLRLVYEFVTSSPADGGLGITPTPGEWDLVEPAMLLHDKEFNDNWIRSWTRKTISVGQLARLREQFGDSTALYFAFLQAYTTSLAFPATLGGLFYFLGKPYHPVYACCLLVYSTVFTEYWRVYERVFTARISPSASFPRSAAVLSSPPSSLTRDKALRRGSPSLAWWRRDLRVLASLPIIVLCAGMLVILMTAIFVFEAFVQHLYAGPGKKFIAFAPTIIFVLLIPQFLAAYRRLATFLTSWENHTSRQSSSTVSVNTYENALATARAKQAHAASLTLKTFVLTSLVSYLGLFLSAFVYVPFGEEVMQSMQVWIATVDVRKGRFGQVIEKLRSLGLNETFAGTFHSGGSSVHTVKTTASIWETDVSGARQKLNPSRLTDQMFASIVTNQISQNFTEVGLPFILRFIDQKPWKKRSSTATSSSASSSSGSTVGSSPGSPSKKHVMFEDEKPPSGVSPAEAQWEAELLEQARREVKLPPYDVFVDYNEMIVQFGYVVVWSSVWGLAPVVAFLNNILESRSDAFKITIHARRPIPERTRTIGPWLDVLTILTWLGALVNASLIYMFGPGNLLGLAEQPDFDPLVKIDVDGQPPEYVAADPPPYSQVQAKKSILLMALLCALASSHIYLLLRALVRRVMERTMLGGKGIEEYSDAERLIDIAASEKEVDDDLASDVEGVAEEPTRMFWKRDDGLDEIARILKEA